MTTSLWLPRALTAFAGLGAAFAIAAPARAGAGDAHATITIKARDAAFGGDEYGGDTGGGAYITQRRDVDVGADGVVRFPGVAATLDPATVEFHSLTDPTGARVVEQRLIGNALDPTTLLAHQVGKPITATLVSGELTGVLRSVDPSALVIESADRALHLVARGPQLLGLTLPSAGGEQDPALEWRLVNAKPGRHSVEVSYRAERLSWRPAYSAILGEDGAIDLASWAAIDNQTGVDFADATVTLSSGGGDGVFATLGMVPGRPATTKPRTWSLPTAVSLRHGEQVQVELAPRKTVAKPRTSIVFEALDAHFNEGNTQPAECGMYAPENPRVARYYELDIGAPLPDGAVRIMRRSPTGLVLVGEDQLRAAGNGVARIPTDRDGELALTGVRTVVQCQPDANGRALVEELELEVRNDGDKSAEVVIREYLFRWHTWKIVRESVKGTRLDDRTQEYRVKVPAGGVASVKLTVEYTW